MRGHYSDLRRHERLWQGHPSTGKFGRELSTEQGSQSFTRVC